MVLAIAGLVLTMAAGAQADVKGKWEGKLTSKNEDGTTREDTALLILDQKGTTITGTIGGDEADQHPISSGIVEGNKVTLLARNKNNGREYRLELAVENDEMKGTVVSGNRTGDILVKRRKE